VEYIQLSEELELRFMAAVKRMKKAFDLCAASLDISDTERDYIHFYVAVRSILFKLTKGDAPDIAQMNARVKEMIADAIQADGVEALFEAGTHIEEVDIFSEDYLAKIMSIPLPNTKVKILQQLLSQAIDEFRKVNKIKGIEFADRLKKVIEDYNNRRKDEKYANEVLDDVAEQLAKLLEELKAEQKTHEAMGIDFEEKAFYDILKAISVKFDFEYSHEKLIKLSREMKKIVDDKAKYTDWSRREDIKAELKVDIILVLASHGYPPVTNDEVFKEIFEQAENFKKYAE
jgi:type I restriction enzyme R subunit